MMSTASRLRQVGWLASLGLCFAVFIVLSFNVHAVKSEVQLAERKIVALERETLILETEFQARSSQRQLANWNAVEFGYDTPRADQYIDGERQLAALGQPQSPGAPEPIKIMSEQTGKLAANSPRKDMVSPVSGEPVTLASNQAEPDTVTAFGDAFGEFLIEASPIRAAQAQTPPAARGGDQDE